MNDEPVCPNPCCSARRWTYDPGRMIATCLRCGTKYTMEGLATLGECQRNGHDWTTTEVVDVRDADGNLKVRQHYRCEVCGSRTHVTKDAVVYTPNKHAPVRPRHKSEAAQRLFGQ